MDLGHLTLKRGITEGEESFKPKVKQIQLIDFL
jgi:hypothetical protein